MEIEQESLKSLRSAAAENYNSCKQEESQKPGPFSSAETPSKKTKQVTCLVSLSLGQFCLFIQIQQEVWGSNTELLTT